MKKLRVLCVTCMLVFMLIGCGSAETSEQLSSEEQELEEIEEMIVGLLEQRAENEAAAAAEAENAEAENTTADSEEDTDMEAGEEIASRVSAYFMGEELLDNSVADNMNEPTINKIRDSGKQVKFMTILFTYEDAWIATPTLVTDTVANGTYGVASRQVNDVTEDCSNIYYFSIVTCPEDVTYSDFKASWEFYQDLDKEVVEATLVEEVEVDDGSIVLDGLETSNIYNFDGSYYALCRGFESFQSSTSNGITTNHSGLRFVLLRGDKSQLDFSKFKLDTTFEVAKEMFAEMNYESLGRFANRDWLCNNGLHPAYDVVAFKGTFEKDVMEAYYVLLADYINDTGYEGDQDLIVSYTNNEGEVINIEFYEY